MDQLNRWLDEWSKSPTGSALIAVLFFLVRIEIDRWARKRERKKESKKKGRANA